MTAPNPSISLVFATSLASLAACSSSLSLGGARERRPAPTSASEQASPAPVDADAPVDEDAPDEASIDARVFAGLSEEASQEAARTFKDELRRGRMSELVPKGDLLEAVTATCGAKIWDQCLVARQPPNKLAWSQWTFKRKDDPRVYRYPDLFYGKVEARWAAQVAGYIITNGGDAGPTLVEMTEGKCGKPVDTRCRVRQRYGAGFVLTVKATGETVDVMATLDVWKRDL
jgi:hypothetical protein